MIRVTYFKNLLIDWLMIDLITFIWLNDIEMKFVIYLMQKFFLEPLILPPAENNNIVKLWNNCFLIFKAAKLLHIL